ncbi:sensor histidine kinase [Sphaerisporangium fuscum]|uniref:sensor histidine kinase n=1 Tax=Sphaerisporangium fuscum TaxID=2835868 RepID=UPI001BDD1AE7|nr:sensor histidine kinase [Sphaerisporangium fuscum]
MDEPGFAALQAGRLRRAHLRVLDAVAAVVLVAVDVAVAGNMLMDDPRFELLFPVSCLVAVVLGVVVAVRRLAPRRAYRIALVVSAVAAACGLLWDPFAAAALSLYPAAAVLPARRSARALWACVITATAAVWIAWAVPLVTGLPARHPSGALPAALWTAAAWLLLGGAWLAGRLVRDRRWDAARLEEQRARRIVADERLRIARELHDVVTHGMGLIAVKAGIANHIAEARPGEARDALRVIEATSRGALTEMRRLLGVLRQGSEQDGELNAPGLSGLAELAEHAAGAGVRVELTVTGDHDLPEALQLTVYRIVQEALTNVVKHAAPTRCRATIDVTPSQVGIQVTDDGRAGGQAATGLGGHGLIGMRERVAMYGGRFTARSRPEGGFTVSATLPLATGPASGREDI